jgi:hypothetical protein
VGLPPPKPDQYPIDPGDIFHIYRQLPIPIKQVRSNFATYGLLDDRRPQPSISSSQMKARLASAASTTRLVSLAMPRSP